jgi:hypothetical protein
MMRRDDNNHVELGYERMDEQPGKLAVIVWNNHISIEIKVGGKILYTSFYPNNPHGRRFIWRFREDNAIHGPNLVYRTYHLDGEVCIYDIVRAHNSLVKDINTLNGLSAVGYVNHLLIAGGLRRSKPYQLNFLLRAEVALGTLVCLIPDKLGIFLGMAMAVPAGLMYLYRIISPRIRKRELPSLTTVLAYEQNILKPLQPGQRCCVREREGKHYHKGQQRYTNIANFLLAFIFIIIGLSIKDDESTRLSGIFAIIYGSLSIIFGYDFTRVTPDHESEIKMNDEEKAPPLSPARNLLVINQTTPESTAEVGSAGNSTVRELQ